MDWQTIWMQCEAKFKSSEKDLSVWRSVEAQNYIATRKLVESNPEQAVLEGLLETVKPSVAAQSESLHFLLMTPFRYPPLLNGSRFGRTHQRGLFYASLRPETALAETAYYHFLFRSGSSADLGGTVTNRTVFKSGAKVSSFADLCVAPFDSYRREISSPLNYAHSQTVGDLIRDSEIDAFSFFSARDKENGINIGILKSECFHPKKPIDHQTWSAYGDSKVYEITKLDPVFPQSLSFKRSDFEIDGKLPLI